MRFNAQMPSPRIKLMVTDICESNAINVLVEFKKSVLGFRQPDGRIDPNGKTLPALNNQTPTLKEEQNG